MFLAVVSTPSELYIFGAYDADVAREAVPNNEPVIPEETLSDPETPNDALAIIVLLLNSVSNGLVDWLLTKNFMLLFAPGVVLPIHKLDPVVYRYASFGPPINVPALPEL